MLPTIYLHCLSERLCIRTETVSLFFPIQVGGNVFEEVPDCRFATKCAGSMSSQDVVTKLSTSSLLKFSCALNFNPHLDIFKRATRALMDQCIVFSSLNLFIRIRLWTPSSIVERYPIWMPIEVVLFPLFRIFLLSLNTLFLKSPSPRIPLHSEQVKSKNGSREVLNQWHLTWQKHPWTLRISLASLKSTLVSSSYTHCLSLWGSCNKSLILYIRKQ